MARMSRRLLLGALVAGAAVVEACSFAIPFDDYRGSATADSGALDGVAVVVDSAVTSADAAVDAPVDAPVEAGPTCNADLQNDARNCGVCGRVCADGGGGCKNGRCPIGTFVDENDGNIKIGEIIGALGPTVTEPYYLYYLLSTGGFGRVAVPTGGSPKHAHSALPIGFIDVANTGKRGVFASGDGLYTFDPEVLEAAPIAHSSHPGLNGLRIFGASAFYWSSEAGIKSSLLSTPDAGAQVSNLPSVARFASESGTLFWVVANGDVWTAADGRAPSRLFASGLTDVTRIRLTETQIYLLENRKAVHVYPWDGTMAGPRSAIIPLERPLEMATGASNVWVIDAEGSPGVAELQRYPSTGGPKVVLASDFKPTGGVFVRGDYIYFADGPRILRTTK